MLLAIDVGNTNTVVGVFDDKSDQPVDNWRLASDSRRTPDEWAALFLSLMPIAGVEAAVLASVVPKVTEAIGRMLHRLGVPVRIVDWQTDTGMQVALDNPTEIGPDRLANAVAISEASAGPAIVVDMGTATTLDVIGANRVYLGGVILPGLEISLDALYDRAAALKRVELSAPDSVIGASTITAVQSGATYGYAAQIDGLCQQIEDVAGTCSVTATGGLSAVIAPLSRKIERHDPWLTLRGLKLIHERNRNR